MRESYRRRSASLHASLEEWLAQSLGPLHCVSSSASSHLEEDARARHAVLVVRDALVQDPVRPRGHALLLGRVVLRRLPHTLYKSIAELMYPGSLNFSMSQSGIDF